ncbi:MAG: caspase family protein, partial [Candidatus Cloacimonadota bacterium]
NGMAATIDYFVSGLSAEDEAFFYYSGHGIHENGVNYLIPAGVNMNDRQVYAGTAYSVRSLAEKFARARSAILFLEASRNWGENPKYFQFTRDCQPNQAIVMSARPYTVVASSNPQRSAFTQAFIQKFNQSEDPFNETMPVLIREFRASGNTRQVPWYSGPINKELYFNLNSTRWRFRQNLYDIEGGGSLSW